MAGESFETAGLRSADRSLADCHVFLDDVTALTAPREIVHEGDTTFTIRDLGSLDGTFVDGHRIGRRAGRGRRGAGREVPK